MQCLDNGLMQVQARSSDSAMSSPKRDAMFDTDRIMRDSHGYD